MNSEIYLVEDDAGIYFEFNCWSNRCIDRIDVSFTVLEEDFLL